MEEDSFFFERPRDSGDILRDLERVKQLRALLEACRKRLRRLEKRPYAASEEIDREKAFSNSVQKELYRLEQHLVLSEFGME
jgi:hypothetical protein